MKKIHLAIVIHKLLEESIFGGVGLIPHFLSRGRTVSSNTAARLGQKMWRAFLPNSRFFKWFVYSSLVCLTPSLGALSRSEPKENHSPSQLTTSYLEEEQSEKSTQAISQNQPPPPSSQQSSSPKKSKAPKHSSTSSVNKGAVPPSPHPPSKKSKPTTSKKPKTTKGNHASPVNEGAVPTSPPPSSQPQLQQPTTSQQ